MGNCLNFATRTSIVLQHNITIACNLKRINYSANIFGRYNYFIELRIWNDLPRDIFDGVVNVKNFKRAISEVFFDILTEY